MSSQQEESEELFRAQCWQRMLADLPSADPPTEHGCRLANFIAHQEKRRGRTPHCDRSRREGE